MKAIVLALVGTGVIVAITMIPKTQTVHVNQEVSTSTPAVEIEEDVVKKAQEELDRINRELDIEEQKINDEIDALKLRLEGIHKTRTSFKSALAQNE